MGKRKPVPTPAPASLVLLKGGGLADQADQVALVGPVNPAGPKTQMSNSDKRWNQNLIGDYFLRSCGTTGPAPSSTLVHKDAVAPLPEPTSTPAPAPAFAILPLQMEHLGPRTCSMASKRRNIIPARNNTRSNSCSALDYIADKGDTDISIAELVLFSSGDECQGSPLARAAWTACNRSSDNFFPLSQKRLAAPGSNSTQVPNTGHSPSSSEDKGVGVLNTHDAPGATSDCHWQSLGLPHQHPWSPPGTRTGSTIAQVHAQAPSQLNILQTPTHSSPTSSDDLELVSRVSLEIAHELTTMTTQALPAPFSGASPAFLNRLEHRIEEVLENSPCVTHGLVAKGSVYGCEGGSPGQPRVDDHLDPRAEWEQAREASIAHEWQARKMDLQLELLQSLAGHVMNIEGKLDKLTLELHHLTHPASTKSTLESSCKFCEKVGEKLCSLPNIMQDLLSELKLNLVTSKTSLPPRESRSEDVV